MDEINNNEQQNQNSLVLRTEGLVKRYGKRTVANGVSINVKQGEIVDYWDLMVLVRQLLSI